MTDHDDNFRESAAAYVLGALEPGERAEFERHLRTCAHCQADVSDFSALPGLLAQVDPESDLDHDPATDRVKDLAIARANHDYGRLQKQSRRWRFNALVATAAAILLVVSFAVITFTDSTSEGVELALVDTTVTGSVVIEERAWGTSIDLDLEGLPERDSYHLWAVGTDGEVLSAATWTSTGTGIAKVTGAAAIPAADIDFISITSADPDDVVLRTN